MRWLRIFFQDQAKKSASVSVQFVSSSFVRGCSSRRCSALDMDISYEVENPDSIPMSVLIFSFFYS